MKICSFAHRVLHLPGMGFIQRRKSVHVFKYGVELIDEDYLSEWTVGDTYYRMLVSSDFKIGRSHMYYDGPHDGLSLGFIHIYWRD